MGWEVTGFLSVLNPFDRISKDGIAIEQFTGLHDKNKDEWYFNDIGKFDNGDKFIIKCKDYLYPYIEWIGDPECEDQVRDFYRIENAKKIGNIHENAELVK